MVKKLPAKQETQVQSWLAKIPWRRKRQPIPAFPIRKSWEIPWTEEPGGLGSMVCQAQHFSPWGHKGVRHDLVTKQQ